MILEQPTEHQEQVALIKWFSEYAPRVGLDERCLFAIPNGGSRNKAGAFQLVLEGVKKGVPDLCLIAPGGRSLWLEMKRMKGGVVSKEQSSFHILMRKLGFEVVVVHGAHDAISAIRNFIEGTNFQ